MNNLRKMVVAALCCLNMFALYAQDIGAENEEDDLMPGVITLDQVVVTGTGTQRRTADSPVPVAVISAKEISDAGASSLEEALTSISPSVSIFTNGMGTTMSLNGINEDYILILVNGRRLAGDDRYTRIAVTDIKRIEVLNGAASALYGSDAIGGVINVITDDGDDAINVSSYTHFSSKSRLTESINADVSSGRLTSRTSYQRRQAGSWQNNDIDENGQYTEKPTSVGFYSDVVSQRFELKASERLTFFLYGSWYDNETRRPQDAIYYSYSSKTDSYTQKSAYTYDLRHETFSYGAGMKFVISPKAYLEAEAFSDNFQSSYIYFTESGDYVPGDELIRKKTHYTDANVKGVFSLGRMGRLSAGVEYVGEQLRSESDNISFRDMFTCSLYAQDELRFSKRMQAVLGLRYIYNENYHSQVVPSVALMYSLGGVNLRASFSTGFRTPTLSQLYATDESKTSNRYTAPNPDLKPEKSCFWSLNAEYTRGRVSLSATGFINDTRDMINYRTLEEAEIIARGLEEKHESFDEVRLRDNIDKAKTQGLSLTVSVNAGGGFSFAGGYTFLHTRAEELQSDGSYVVSPIDKSIKHTATFSCSYGHSFGRYRLNVCINGRLQGKRYSQTYGYAPKCQQWDLCTRHSFSLRSLTLEPGVGIENVFNDIDDRPWNSNFSTLHPGRSLFVSLLVRFRD